MCYCITSKGGTRVGHSVLGGRTTGDDDDTRVGRVLCAGWRNSPVLLVVRARSLATRIGLANRARVHQPRIRRILIGTWPDPNPDHQFLSRLRTEGKVTPHAAILAHNSTEKHTRPTSGSSLPYVEPQRCPSLDRDTRYYFCRCSPISRFSRYRFIYRVQ